MGINPKKHHYLPQFYMRGFALDANLEQIVVYPKARISKSFVASIDSTACINNFHEIDYAKSDSERYAFERSLAKIEHAQSLILQKLLSNKRLNSEDLPGFGEFVAMMQLRIPTFADHVRDFHRENVQEMMDLLYERGRLPEPPPELKEALRISKLSDLVEIKISNWKLLQFMFDPKSIHALASQLHGRNIGLVESDGRIPFVTCDNPVVLYCEDYASMAPYGATLLFPNVELNIPISKDLMVIFSHATLPEHRIANDVEVSEYNRRTIINAQKYIYGPVNDGDLAETISKNWQNSAGFKLDILKAAGGAYFITRRTPVSTTEFYEKSQE